MKRKIVTIAMSLVLALSLAACGGKKEESVGNAASGRTETGTKEKTETGESTGKKESAADEATKSKTEEPAKEDPTENSIPTTAEEIWAYMQDPENVKPGETMMSDDNILFVSLPYYGNGKPEEERSVCYAKVEMFDGKAFAVISTEFNQIGTYRELVDSGTSKVFYNFDNYNNTEIVHNELLATVTEEFDRPIGYWYARVEPTDSPDRVKVIIKYPDAQWFRDHFIDFGLQAKINYGELDAGAKSYFRILGEYADDPLYVEYDRFEGDTITFYTDPKAIFRNKLSGELIQMVPGHGPVNVLESEPDVSAEALTAGIFGGRTSSTKGYTEAKVRSGGIVNYGYIDDSAKLYGYMEPEY